MQKERLFCFYIVLKKRGDIVPLVSALSGASYSSEDLSTCNMNLHVGIFSIK